jgi:type IV pilus assembly protein PilV
MEIAGGSRQRGASLIEVMVALFILAIGLLGYAGMQTQGITLGRKAYAHSQAVFLAQDLVERIRANPANPAIYAINFGEDAFSAVNCRTTNCTADEMAEWDRSEWLDLVESALPGGEGEVAVATVGGVDLVTVRIRYRLATDRLNPGEAAPSNEEQTYTYTLETQI